MFTSMVLSECFTCIRNLSISLDSMNYNGTICSRPESRIDVRFPLSNVELSMV